MATELIERLEGVGRRLRRRQRTAHALRLAPLGALVLGAAILGPAPLAAGLACLVAGLGLLTGERDRRPAALVGARLLDRELALEDRVTNAYELRESGPWASLLARDALVALESAGPDAERRLDRPLPWLPGVLALVIAALALAWMPASSDDAGPSQAAVSDDAGDRERADRDRRERPGGGSAGADAGSNAAGSDAAGSDAAGSDAAGSGKGAGSETGPGKQPGTHEGGAGRDPGRGEEQKPGNKKPDNKKPGNRKPDTRKPGSRKPDNKKPDNKKPGKQPRTGRKPKNRKPPREDPIRRGPSREHKVRKRRVEVRPLFGTGRHRLEMETVPVAEPGEAVHEARWEDLYPRYVRVAEDELFRRPMPADDRALVRRYLTLIRPK